MYDKWLYTIIKLGNNNKEIIYKNYLIIFQYKYKKLI